MLQRLRGCNPNIQIYSVNDDEFIPYGKVLNGYDVSEMIEECSKIKMPESGILYELSLPELENLAIAKKFEAECFGGMKIQVGLCWGHNKQMNGLEFHKSSEVNIAVTPMIVLLGQVTQMKGSGFDSKNVKGFYVEKGQVIEMYGTTLHYAPCEVSEKGFASIVILHKGTNDVLDLPVNDPLLVNKNKWLICHESSSLKDQNIYPGIDGENIQIQY